MMAEHDLAIVTPHHAHTDDEMLCDPCFWTADEFNGATPDGFTAETAHEAWNETRAHKTLSERLCEIGGEVFTDLLWSACEGARS